jgi:hypothetical protein
MSWYLVKHREILPLTPQWRVFIENIANYNIKMGLEGIECKLMDWIQLVQDKYNTAFTRALRWTLS